MNLKVNIDPTLRDRSPEYLQGILHHMEEGLPFVLYHNTRQYLIASPSERKVICIAGGAIATNEILKSDSMFLARIQIAMTVYENFDTINKHNCLDWLRPLLPPSLRSLE